MVAAILQLYALPRKDSLIHILSFRRCVHSVMTHGHTSLEDKNIISAGCWGD